MTISHQECCAGRSLWALTDPRGLSLSDVTPQVPERRSDIVRRKLGTEPFSELIIVRDRYRGSSGRTLGRDRIIAGPTNRRVGNEEELVEVIPQDVRLKV